MGFQTVVQTTVVLYVDRMKLDFEDDHTCAGCGCAASVVRHELFILAEVLSEVGHRDNTGGGARMEFVTISERIRA